MPIRRVNNCASGLGRVKDAGARQNVAGWGCECAAKRKKHSDVLCFLVAGRRMFQSPGGLLLILSVRPHCTQESSQDAVLFSYYAMNIKLRSLRSLPVISTPAALKAAFSVNRVDARSLREKLDAYKRKKHSDVLCFLVAGRRIELRTS